MDLHELNPNNRVSPGDLPSRIPADGELYHSAGKLYLTKLQLATAYQARVKSHNKEGMSSWSHSFTFATRGGGEETVWQSAFVSGCFQSQDRSR